LPSGARPGKATDFRVQSFVASFRGGRCAILVAQTTASGGELPFAALLTKVRYANKADLREVSVLGQASVPKLPLAHGLDRL